MSLLEDFNKCISNKWITIGDDFQYAMEGNTIYIQCSRSPIDWKYNLDFPVELYKDSFLVHRGFAHIYKQVREELLSLPIQHIRGFSHGANMGVLLHEDIFFNKKFVPDTQVFGASPILFLPSKKIQNRFHSVKIWNNKEDIMRFAPPFYTMVGQVILLDHYVKKPDSVPLLEWYSGHSPSLYRPRLQEVSCLQPI